MTQGAATYEGEGLAPHGAGSSAVVDCRAPQLAACSENAAAVSDGSLVTKCDSACELPCASANELAAVAPRRAGDMCVAGSASHGEPRWYAIAVRAGSERALAELVTRVAGPVLAEPAFRPAFEAEVKVRGRWVRTTKSLVDGYVVAITTDAEALAESLRLIGSPCRLLGVGGEPAPLSREAALLLGGLGKPGRRVVPLSRGHKLADGSVVVDEGPLVGREALIERIDRHKSLAYLRLDVAGELVRARAGLAVLPDGAAVRTASPRDAMPEGWAQARLEGVA